MSAVRFAYARVPQFSRADKGTHNKSYAEKLTTERGMKHDGKEKEPTDDRDKKNAEKHESHERAFLHATPSKELSMSIARIRSLSNVLLAPSPDLPDKTSSSRSQADRALQRPNVFLLVNV